MMSHITAAGRLMFRRIIGQIPDWNLRAVCASSLLFILLAGTNLYGQDGTLVGIVTDSTWSEPVSYSHASVDSATYGEIADENGVFVIAGISPGTHYLDVSRIGYSPITDIQFEISSNDTTFIEIELAPISYLSEEVVVTAANRTQSIKNAPVSALNVSRAQILQRSIQTFDQALDESPGIVVIRSSGSNVQSVSIRGASETAGGGSGNRVMLLIDGRPALSPESGGPLWTLAPLNSVHRIEVVKGAYSALYGSSAVGGVINVITRNPTSTPETTINLSYGVHGKVPAKYNFSGYRDFGSIELSHSQRVGRFDYLIDGGYKRNQGHREKSGFELYNLFGKFRYQFAPNRFLRLTANLNKINNDTPATWLSPDRAYEVADYKIDDYQYKTEGSVDLYYSAITNSDVKYTSRFYYYTNKQDFVFNGDPENDSTNINIGKQFLDASSVKTWRLGNMSQIDCSFPDDHYAIVGLDVKYDYTLGLPDSILYGEHNALEVGVYAQDEWSPSEQVTITAGLRFDYYEIVGDFSEINISPKIAAVYRPTEEFSIRGLFARAFRNPSIAERYIQFEQGGGLLFEPNPGLRSEKLVASFELGAKYSYQGKFSVDVAGYHNRYKDLISFVQVSKPLEPLTFMVVNLKEAVIQGFEASVVYRPLDWLGFTAGYAFLDARDISEDRVNDKLAYKPRHTYSAGIDVDYKRFGAYLRYRGRSEIEEVFIYPDSNPEAYSLLDLKLTYAFARTHSYWFSINNIFNTQYEELERYRMPGRNYSMGVSLKF